ncbi:MAG: hypothetical protein AB1346_08745 [Thermodesulfobacteriota bacterium]
MVVERMKRSQVTEVTVGSQHNSEDIETIINEDRWPKVECKVCGESHSCAIMKVVDTLQGGEFKFVEPACPNRPGAEKPAE